MKLTLALALSTPALAGAFGAATCDPKDSQLKATANGSPSLTYGYNGNVCTSNTNTISNSVVPFTSFAKANGDGEKCFDACVLELGCNGFESISFDTENGCRNRVLIQIGRALSTRSSTSAQAPARLSATFGWRVPWGTPT